MSKEIRILGQQGPKVKLADLHIRYIPVITPLEIWQKMVANAYDLMCLPTSPHVELMQTFRDYGKDWIRIKAGRYYAERRYRREVGMARWTEDYIENHIRRRYNIFKSIYKHGYNVKKCKDDPVVVLQEPFWKTRFGRTDIWLHGREIWNGAGRCAAMWVLGHKFMQVCLAEDKYPGTGYKGKFESKLKGIEGVF